MPINEIMFMNGNIWHSRELNHKAPKKQMTKLRLQNLQKVFSYT